MITMHMKPRMPKKGPREVSFCQGTCTFMPQIPDARLKGMIRVATEEKVRIALSMLYEYASIDYSTNA